MEEFRRLSGREIEHLIELWRSAYGRVVLIELWRSAYGRVVLIELWRSAYGRVVFA